jgi:hypothetical protein
LLQFIFIFLIITIILVIELLNIALFVPECGTELPECRRFTRLTENTDLCPDMIGPCAACGTKNSGRLGRWCKSSVKNAFRMGEVCL